jgi:hypothetical protein
MCNLGQAWFRLGKRKMNTCIPFKCTIIRSTAVIIWDFCPLTPPPPLQAHKEGITQLVARNLFGSFCCSLYRSDCEDNGWLCCRRVRVVAKNSLLASSYPPVHPSVRLYQHRCNWKDLVLRTFTKIYRRTPNLVKFGQQCRALCMKTYVLRIVAGDINSL